ncbi:MAG: STAS domain-containing protein [Verrucomicrobiota bacterium]
MDDPSTSPDPSAVLRIDGSFHLHTVAEWHGRLVSHLAATGALTLDLSAATEVDTCAVQLLLAARRSAREAGASFALQEPGEDLARACADIGVSLLNDLSPLS